MRSPLRDAFAVRFDPCGRSGRDSVRSAQCFRVRQPPSLPLLGGGACFIDFDGDGRHDLLLPGGAAGCRSLPQYGQRKLFRCHAGSGLEVSGEALGCTVGDYDNDGRDDLVVGFQGASCCLSESGSTAHSGMSRRKPAFVSTAFLWESSSGLRPRWRSWIFTFRGSRTFHSARAVNSTFLSVRSRQAEIFCGATMATAHLPTGPTPAGLAGDAPGIAALPADFNNDRAIDLILTGWRSSPAVLTNPAKGRFDPSMSGSPHSRRLRRALSRSISTKMDGWIWHSRIGANPDSAFGKTLPAMVSNV